MCGCLSLVSLETEPETARGARDLLSKCSGWGGNYKGLREAGQRRGRVQARPWFQVNSPWSDDRRRRQVLRQRRGGWRLGSAALATWQHVGVVCGGRAGGDCSAPHGGTRPLSWAQDPLRASTPPAASPRWRPLRYTWNAYLTIRKSSSSSTLESRPATVLKVCEVRDVYRICWPSGAWALVKYRLWHWSTHESC